MKKREILRSHADATLIETVPVKETFNGQTVWNGKVEVFDLQQIKQIYFGWVEQYALCLVELNQSETDRVVSCSLAIEFAIDSVRRPMSSQDWSNDPGLTQRRGQSYRCRV